MIREQVNARAKQPLAKGHYMARPVPWIGCCCGAKPGDPCIGKFGDTLTTHSDRRMDFTAGLRGIKKLFELLRVL